MLDRFRTFMRTAIHIRPYMIHARAAETAGHVHQLGVFNVLTFFCLNFTSESVIALIFPLGSAVFLQETKPGQKRLLTLPVKATVSNYLMCPNFLLNTPHAKTFSTVLNMSCTKIFSFSHLAGDSESLDEKVHHSGLYLVQLFLKNGAHH